MAAAEQDAPVTPMELDEAAHTLLSAMRAIAIGRAECPAVRRMVADLCGASGDEALNMLFVVMKQLAFTSRRRLSVHMPGCCRISGDELTFLSAIAAAQDGSAEAGRRTDRWLSRLTGRNADPGLVRSVRSLGGLLSSAGCRVCFGEPPAPAAAPALGPRTLH